MGAVYMGALTYIGNAPNFMIYAIATERGIKMPSFFGYMVWSIAGIGAGLRRGDLFVCDVVRAHQRSRLSIATQSCSAV